MSGDAATTVLLVRHASHDRLDRILCGRMPDVRLGEAGLAQADSLARRLAGSRIAAVFSSPLERARETAAPIAGSLGVPIQTDDGINEIDMGAWTGAAFDALQGDERWHVWNRHRAAGRAPDGEAMAAVQERVQAALEGWRLAHPGAAILGVSHSDVIKAAVCGVLGLSLDRYGSFEIGPASITTLVLWQGGGKVLSLNDRAGG